MLKVDGTQSEARARNENRFDGMKGKNDKKILRAVEALCIQR